LEPTNPYAATKAGAEFLAKSYHRSFNMPIIITRGNNVYGPHQYPEKLIPKFINQLMRGRSVTLHGTGGNTRNFLFVEDVARAFEIVLFKAELGMIYNIGGTNEKTNLEVAQQLIKLAGYDGPAADRMTFVEDRVFNDLRYFINSERLLALGWREQVFSSQRSACCGITMCSPACAVRCVCAGGLGGGPAEDLRLVQDALAALRRHRLRAGRAPPRGPGQGEQLDAYWLYCSCQLGRVGNMGYWALRAVVISLNCFLWRGAGRCV
jgi:hypothetical protein